MRISALRLFNVKRFGGRGVAIEGIGDGVSVLCAANEAGKSTSFEALHALFFQPHSGTPGEIQRLRPYSGGSPLVEADIATDAGPLRITKQFYAGRTARVVDLATGRLIAQADEAERLIADLTRGGASGPAGLLWVRQGVTGIERRRAADEENEKRIRLGLLESVQGEVEAVTGGRRMAAILAEAQGALADLVAGNGKPKAGGRYAAAIEARDRLAAEETRLAADVRALREALTDRAAAERRLAELDGPEDRQARHRAILEAQARFDAAKSHGEALKAAQAGLDLVRARRDAAAGDLAAFRKAVDRAGELQRQVGDAQRRRSEALAGRREAIAAIAQARAAAEAAEARERDARDLLAGLEAAARARAASERLAGLRARLSQAETARQALEEGEAQLALAKTPPDAIDDLQAVEVEIAKLRAIEQAARPSVTILYETGAALAATMDGAPLTDGEERGYEDQAVIRAPGVGTITLRSNRPRRGDDRLEVAEAKRSALLGSLGVADLAAARARQARARRMDAELGELRVRLSLLAPEGLARLREQAMAQDPPGEAILQPARDPAEARAALAEAEALRMGAQRALRDAEPRRESVEDAFVAAERDLAALKAGQAHVDAILGPPGARDETAQGLADALAALEDMFAQAGAQAARLRDGAADLDKAEATLTRAHSVRETAEKQIGALRETIAGLNAEIRTRSDEAIEEAWRETAEALCAARTRAASFEREAAVLQRLSSALEAARSSARELYLKPVMTELKPLLGLLFDDAAITFDDRTLLPQTIRRGGEVEDVDRLSGGMREQLSVLTRLAFARLLARDGRPAPVILDDALVYSDDDRIEKMFDALHRQSRDLQIIVFSCRERAFQKLGGASLKMTDWRP